MQLLEDDLSVPIGRLRKFISDHLNGQCKVISEGSNCQCPLCDLDRIQETLKWYAEEAQALSKNMIAKQDMAVLASVKVLSLDAGKRVKDLLGENDGKINR